MGKREEQLGENEAVFREINETVADIASLTAVAKTTLFHCECGDESCVANVALTYEQYEEVRAEADRFVVVPGHVRSEAERIVAQHSDWWIVEKVGDAGEIAEETDPRA